MTQVSWRRDCGVDAAPRHHATTAKVGMAIVTLLLVAAAILVAHHSQATQGPVERSLSSDSGQALLLTELGAHVDTADASDENEAAYLVAGGMTVIVGCLAGLFILGVRAWFGRVVPCLSSTGDRVLGPTTSSAPRRIIGWLRPELAALCVNRT